MRELPVCPHHVYLRHGLDDGSTDEENIQELLNDSDEHDINDKLTEETENNNFIDIIDVC